jgi:hypothetical protein
MDTLASIDVLEPGVVQFSVRFFTYSKPLGSYPDTRSLSAANGVEEAMADRPTGTRILGAFCFTLAFAIAAHIGAALGQPQLKNEPQSGLASAARPEGVAGDVLQRIDLRVSLLHAGAEAADVERVLGRPTTTTVIEESAGGRRVLVYAEEPVRTQVLLTDDHVTAIALDLPHIDITLLPAHARMVKPMMVRAGVLALLGRPTADQRWTVSGLALEQMMFARAGEADFSVFLVDGLVVDVRPGAERPSNILHVVLPTALPDATVGSDLRIGLNPNQAASLLGPAAWMATTSIFKGQPVLHATYYEHSGPRLVSLTFTGGALTAFAIWPPGAALDLADTCCSATR